MERRVIPALHLEVSWASLLLPSGSGARGARAGNLLIEPALEAGVNLFDAGGSPEAEMLLGDASRNGHEVVVLITPDVSANRASRDSTAWFRTDLEEHQRRCGSRSSLVAVLGPQLLTSDRGSDLRRLLEEETREGAILGWGVRVPPEGMDLEKFRTLLAAGAAVAVGDYSLLRRQPAAGLLGALDGTGARWIATDPFCGGRLDGSWFEGSPMQRDASSGPIRLSHMRTSLGPVLALGFLTKNRTRTLPEAALRFPLLSPAVASVVGPLGRPGMLSTILSAERSPPFDSSELETLGTAPTN